MIRPVRVLLVLVGVVAAAYGTWRLLDLGWPNTRATLPWLAGGVLLHDAVFAPVVLMVSLVATRTAPRRWLAPAVVALVVLVPVTLAGIPELGRLGARADRPTLLDRDYWRGWWAMVTLVVVLVATGTAARATIARRRTVPGGGGGDHGPRDGGR